MKFINLQMFCIVLLLLIINSEAYERRKEINNHTNVFNKHRLNKRKSEM
jgi:hypothetical protein